MDHRLKDIKNVFKEIYCKTRFEFQNDYDNWHRRFRVEVIELTEKYGIETNAGLIGNEIWVENMITSLAFSIAKISTQLSTNHSIYEITDTYLNILENKIENELELMGIQ